MEEIKLNMENLTKEERDQLLELVKKSSDTAKKDAKKKELIDQVLDNIKAFYGKKMLSLKRAVFEKYAERVISNLVDEGYKIYIVPSVDFIRTRWDAHKNDIKTDKLHCPVEEVHDDYDLVQYIKDWIILSGSPTIYIYIPLYKDLNDGKYKTCWFFEYDDKKPGEVDNNSMSPKVGKGEIYYYINCDGDIKKLTQRYLKMDEKLYNLGNYFKTEEEAKFALEKHKIMIELKLLAKQFNAPTEVPTWELIYDKRTEELRGYRSIWHDYITGGIKFTEEALERVIKTIDKERLKKYYFDIKE